MLIVVCSEFRVEAVDGVSDLHRTRYKRGPDVLGSEFRDSGFGIWVLGFWSRSRFGFGVSDFGFRVSDC